MNDALITECSVVRGSVHKRGYGHKQATAAPSVAGGSETADCGGDVAAGLVGIASGATLRRERQSGFCLAAALSGRCGGTDRASLTAGNGGAGSARRGGPGPRGRGDRGPSLRGVDDPTGCLLVSALFAIPRSVVVDQIVYRHEVDEQAVSIRPILLPCRGFVSRLSPLHTLGILRLAHGDLGLAVPRQGSILRLINHQIGPQPFPLDESLGRELVLGTEGEDCLAANLCDVHSH